MAGDTNAFSMFRKHRQEDEEERALKDALMETREQLKYARIYFDNVADPELVDESVFEINALQARHSYLIRRLKEKEAEELTQAK
jgi:hypothetical protein